MEVLDLKATAEQAIALHQQGKLDQAEALYLQILQADPALFGPRYYLGILRMQQGRFEEASILLGEASTVYPDDLGCLMNYGMALRAAGHAEEALAAFDRALAIQPSMAEGLYNRGVALSDLKRYELAVESYDRALVLQPEMIAAMVNRAVALTAVGRFDDAIVGYDRVLAMQPSNAGALMHRGLARRAMGQPGQALEDYNRALALAPGHAETTYNRGVIMLDLERAAEALADFDAVMPAYQGNAEMLNNRGVALRNLKRHAESLDSLDRALALEPNFPEAWGNRSLALRDMLRFEDALASLDQVLLQDITNSVALNWRGNVCRDMKDFVQAIDCYSRALRVRPDYAEAMINRSYSYWSLKQPEAALADLERGIALEPHYPYARGELMHMRMYCGDWHAFEADKTALEGSLRAGARIVQPFIFQAVSENPQDSQICSRIWGHDRYPALPAAPFDTAARKAHTKIRIGYLSGEFRQQATAILMAGLYERHDRERFELVALDNGPNDGGALRSRLEKSFDRWIDIGKMHDADAASRIRAEEIDILVNLNGYFGDGRSGVFAHRAAPVQVNYLGFPATLGANYMDYIIADETVIPPGEHGFYDEEVVTLPGSYQVNDDKGRPMARQPSRAEAGLPETGTVFCNFNNAYKLTPATFDSWMRILKQVDGSVLWLLESPAPYADNLRKEAAARGVAPERLVFAPELDTDLHLARLSLADLFLDGLPYNAHTTGSDALWTGVPLITTPGTTFPGRVAASLLGAAGLPELITADAAGFEALAVKLGKDAKALKALKDKLAKNKSTCALFDTAAFARHIEAAYTRMWESWLAGENPKGFAVAQNS
ncbi:MAG: tetratricopeptide repeat protein [Alphaproteobacteria bacterium]|nr:tetratricopeptide repeat protein [Alphaproteobacteria bacterium]